MSEGRGRVGGVVVWDAEVGVAGFEDGVEDVSEDLEADGVAAVEKTFVAREIVAPGEGCCWHADLRAERTFSWVSFQPFLSGIGI